MFRTLIGKFTILYWLLFTAVIIPLYLYSYQHFHATLKSTEEEKVRLTFETLQPIIAYNLSFNQKELVAETLNNFYEHQDIAGVQLVSQQGEQLYLKMKPRDDSVVYYLYESVIVDPFSDAELAKASIRYSNEHLDNMIRNLTALLAVIFMIAFVIFMLGFFYLREDLEGLSILSNWLRKYMVTKDIEPIEIPGKSREVHTIATVANEMVRTISDYVRQLEGFNKDLEQRVQAALDKQHDQERLMVHQSRQAAMGEMLESIAHQWRQPLNNIGLAVTSMETKRAFGPLDENEFGDKMKIISDNIHYMSDTIDDFRNFLTPRKAKDLFVPEKTVHDVLMILDAQFQNNGIAHTIKSNCHLELHGIENEFKQVLLVLLNNAKDAIKEQLAAGMIQRGEITVEIKCLGDRAAIEIRDNGGGIDASIQHSIFEPYFTTKFQNQGTGIGLYMAKNIIENRMEGTLKMENIESGSCFTITLPVQKEETCDLPS